MEYLADKHVNAILGFNQEKVDPPPDGLGPDDLASQLCLHMGVGRSNANMIAASDALRLKAWQPDYTVSKAYMHILAMWHEYKRSARYKSEFRRKASDWLTEADYDNPPSWGGRSLIQRQPPVPKPLEGVALWSQDKKLHPENYATAEDMKNFVEQVKELFGRKRMPNV